MLESPSDKSGAKNKTTNKSLKAFNWISKTEKLVSKEGAASIDVPYQNKPGEGQ